MLKKWALAVGLLVIVPFAMAASEGGFYVAAGIGDADQDGTVQGVDADDSDTGYRLILGFDLFPHWSMEGGYVDFGDVDARIPALGLRTRAETDGVVIGSRYQYEFAHHVYLQARAGVFLWDIESSTISGATRVDVNEDGTDLYYGIGIRYDFDDHWAVSGEYTHYEADLDVDFLSATLYYYFDF